jgi:hypothetical protein
LSSAGRFKEQKETGGKFTERMSELQSEVTQRSPPVGFKVGENPKEGLFYRLMVDLKYLFHCHLLSL